MSELRLITRNWDPKAEYDFGIGFGYFFRGYRTWANLQGEWVRTPLGIESRIRNTFKTLRNLLDSARAYGKPSPVVIINDASPIPFPILNALRIVGDAPLLYAELPSNKGVGCKENIIQRILAERCKYIIRYDDDSLVYPFSFKQVKRAFRKDVPDAWAITSCITYFARMLSAKVPEETRYFTSANLADFAVFRSSIFGKVGYSDPKMRWNNDGDLRLRCLAFLDMNCYVDKKIIGRALPTGAGVDLNNRLKLAAYIQRTRPFIKVIFLNTTKTPRLALDRKAKEIIQSGVVKEKVRFVPAHPWGEKIAEHVWK